MEARFKNIAAEAGLAFEINERIYNTRLAHELSVWATEQNKSAPFHKAVFEANYIAGRDISNAAVLAEIAASVGLAGEEAVKVLAERRYSAMIDKDWAVCRERDIAAAPTFMIGPFRLVGAQAYETMADFAIRSGAVKKTS